MRTGRPRIRTLEQEKEYERNWIAKYREKLRTIGKMPMRLHPEVVNRRKQRGGRRTAELIRLGVHHVPVPGMGWKTTLQRDPNGRG